MSSRYRQTLDPDGSTCDPDCKAANPAHPAAPTPDQVYLTVETCTSSRVDGLFYQVTREFPECIRTGSSHVYYCIFVVLVGFKFLQGWGVKSISVIEPVGFSECLSQHFHQRFGP